MAVEFKDYYDVLGLPKNASAETIKKAFRKLARQFHPDVAKDKKGAEEKFKELNEANEVLGDPEKRRKYDELGSDPDRHAPSQRKRAASENESDFHFDGTGFSDFFEQYFGGRSRSTAGVKRSEENGKASAEFPGTARM